jgi:hypothetical protein
MPIQEVCFVGLGDNKRSALFVFGNIYTVMNGTAGFMQESA